MTTSSAVSAPIMRPDLGAHQLGGVRVALLRHDRGAGGEGVGQRARSRTAASPRCTISSAKRDRCMAQIDAGRERLQREVAVGDAVERIGGRAGRSRAPWPSCARSIGKDVPASAAAPSGLSFSRSGRRRSGRGRGRASRHRPSGDGRRSPAGPICRWVKPGITVAGCSSARWPAPRCRSRDLRVERSLASRTQRRKSIATWSLRERAVCSRPAAGADQSRRAAPSTFMWMSSSARENVNAACLDFGRDLL